MGTWGAFERAAPELAANGRRLLYRGETGAGFLGTVRKDGGPRVHPIFPILADGELFGFIVNLGWKYHDLVRDGRYALHSFPSAEGGEEFYVTGRAALVTDAGRRARVVAATGDRQGKADFEALFTFDIERALYTHWANWGTAETWPTFTKWGG